ADGPHRVAPVGEAGPEATDPGAWGALGDVRGHAAVGGAPLHRRMAGSDRVNLCRRWCRWMSLRAAGTHRLVHGGCGRLVVWWWRCVPPPLGAVCYRRVSFSGWF